MKLVIKLWVLISFICLLPVTLFADLPAITINPLTESAVLFKGNAQIDGRDSGYVDLRVLPFTKKYGETETDIRITYCDSLRVYGNGKACSWHLKVIGLSDSSGSTVTLCSTDLMYSIHNSSTNQNTHRPATLVGYCQGLFNNLFSSK